ncbi:hypothetical protein, partial [Serratia marcescens]|uniref:hypothetical protein n=1 Tax=Serratia marcescens TaxID=615 RepID=UPI002813C2C5
SLEDRVLFWAGSTNVETGLKQRSFVMLSYMKERLIIELIGWPKAKMMNDVLILKILNDMLEVVEIKLARLNELGPWCAEYHMN